MPMFVSNFRTVPLIAPVVGALFLAGCAQGEDLPPSMLGSGTSITSGGESGTNGTLSTGSGGSDNPGSGGSDSPSTSTGAGGSTGTGGTKGAGGSNGSSGSTGAAGSSAGTGGKGGSSNSGGSGGSATAHDAGAAGSGTGGSNVSTCSPEGGLPSGMRLLSEDFEDGTANGWVSPAPADWSIVDDGSKVYKQSVSQGNSTVHLSAAGDASWSNVIIEARVKPAFGGSSSSYFAGVCARLKDANNFYCAVLRSDGKFGIRARLDSNGTNLGNAVNVMLNTTQMPIADGKWYTVKLKVVGSNLEATVTGPAGETATATASDCQVTNGGVGFAVAGMAAEFDDVKVTTP